ncbi:MAG: TonB-dependent receptor [Bacteroidia bacterium]
MNRFFYTAILLLVSSTGLLYSQTTIEVFNANSGEVLNFSIKMGDSLVHSTEGKLILEVLEEQAVIISSEGFDEQERLIKDGEHYRVYLFPSINRIGEIVVTDVHSIKNRHQSVLNVSRINSKKLEQLGAVDLRDALSFENNIRINRDNALGTSGLSLMGIGGSNVKIMVDGVPVIGRLFGQLDLEQFNMENTAQLEVIKGPMSVIYGSNALAGTINLISKHDFKDRASIRATYESDGQYHLSGTFSKAFGKQMLTLSGGRMLFDGWSALEEDRTFDWIPKEQYNGRLAYEYRNDSFKLQYRSEILHAFLLDRGKALAPYGEFAIDQKYTNIRLDNSVNAYWERKHCNLSLIAGHNYFKRKKLKYYKDLVNLTEQLIPLAEEQDTQGFNAYVLRGIYGFTHGEYETLLGVDANHERGTGKRLSGLERVQTDLALFTSTEIKFSKLWIVRTGLRYAYNSAFKSPLIYSVQSRLDLNRFQILKIAYGKGFRAPSLKELYLDFSDSRHDVYGNDQLQAETSHSFTLTYQKFSKWDKWLSNTSLDLFYNYITDKIELTVLGPTEATYNNISTYETIGGSLNQNFSYEQFKINLSANYTGIRTALIEGESSYNFSPQYVIQPSYTSSDGNFSVNLFYNHFGKISRVFEDSSSGELSISQLASYSMFDFSLNQKLMNKRLNMTLGARNLFNVVNIASTISQAAHTESSNSVSISPGRTIFITLRYAIIK